MARYFKEQDIDEFRECFYLFARSGQITSLDELTVVMRSLGMSPTIQELTGLRIYHMRAQFLLSSFVICCKTGAKDYRLGRLTISSEKPTYPTTV
ncbi:unnamed protein product [Leptidea sinapis]|uniref:EF-hand domain-containing protein n=1 Tax=Leptidea sinapis TaxID=189913 RepID=A0A5E4QIN3_9NEOP|nr:unnamed protein product [Leptidea sinapis]